MLHIQHPYNIIQHPYNIHTTSIQHPYNIHRTCPLLYPGACRQRKISFSINYVIWLLSTTWAAQDEAIWKTNGNRRRCMDVVWMLYECCMDVAWCCMDVVCQVLQNSRQNVSAKYIKTAANMFAVACASILHDQCTVNVRSTYGQRTVDAWTPKRFLRIECRHAKRSNPLYYSRPS